MDNTVLAAIVVSAISGSIGAWIASAINMAMARDTRKHEKKEKKKENIRLLNAEITRLTSTLKGSLAIIKTFVNNAVYNRVYYYKAFYGNQIRFNEQDEDNAKLKDGQLSDAEKGKIEMRIENRAGKITRAAESIKSFDEKSDQAVDLLNEELVGIIKTMHTLSQLTGKDLSESEARIIEFMDMGIDIVDLNEIRKSMMIIKTNEALNDYMFPAELNPEPIIKESVDKYIGYVNNMLNTTNFYQ